MGDVVKKGIDVGVEDPAEALVAQLADLMDRGAHGASGAVGVAARFEFLFEDLPREQVHRRLDHPVAHRGNGKVAHPGGGLRNGNAQERERMVDAAQEAVLEPVDLLFQVLVEVIEADAIRPAAAAVVPDALAGRIKGLALGELVEHVSHHGTLDTGGREKGYGLGELRSTSAQERRPRAAGSRAKRRPQSHVLLRAIPSGPEHRRLRYCEDQRRNPTVLLRAIPRHAERRRGHRVRAVAIPPYCSGQFQGCRSAIPPRRTSCRNPTVLLRAIPRGTHQYTLCQAGRVAIPPYCSGQFQGVCRDRDRRPRTSQSQSHRTAQGNSKATSSLTRPGRCSTSQSHRTAQGNSKKIVRSIALLDGPKSQSHRTAQGNSKDSPICWGYAESVVAIPPYCSGQFQVRLMGSGCCAYGLRRNPTVLLRAIPRPTFSSKTASLLLESQSHRTAQGNSERDPAASSPSPGTFPGRGCEP